ncbi:MAG: hypothetical protein LKF31_07665 [Muribaculaceae bacterium]|jgi:hypothetical protein|nr:hypothetical protein [Muribaculaceae bacterium]
MKKFLLGAAFILAALLGCFSAQAQNAYAYGLKVGALSADGSSIPIYYSLNTAAKAVSIDVYQLNVTTPVKSFVSDQLKAGADTFVVATAGLPTGVDLYWTVKVQGTTVTAPVFVKKLADFYAPYGLAVDRDPFSTHFGRLYATESKDGSGSMAEESVDPNTYLSYKDGKGNGQALYVFEANGDTLRASNGKPGFIGGLNIASKFSTKGAFDPKRLAISEDGRLFISRLASGVSPIYEVNTDNLDAAFSPIFTDTLQDADMNLMTVDSAYVAGGNVALTVRGEGDNLTLATISAGKASMDGYDQSSYRAAEYALGSAKTWTGVPTRIITDYDKQYTITYDNTNLLYDPNGGLWFTASRGTASESQPIVKHVKNDFTTEDFSITSNTNDYGIVYPANSGICVSPDSTMIAMITARTVKTVKVYKVDYTTNPVTLTMVTSFTAQDRPNALAWDYADNLFSISSSNEVLDMYQLPRDTDVVVTPCIDDQVFKIPAPTATITLASKNTTVPTAANNRQGVFIDNNWFIMNKTDKTVDVYDGEGNKMTTTFPAAACTNIGNDDAGNLIVRTGDDFPSANTTGIRVIPTDGSTPVDIAISGVPAARNDWYGTAQGNLLRNGKLYIMPNNSTKLTVVQIKNGAQDVDNTQTIDVPGATASYNVVYSFTPGKTEHVMVCPRGASYLDGTLAADNKSITTTPLVMPGKATTLGATFFTMGGVNYVVYPSGTNYMDGFSVAKVSTDATNEAIATYAPTVTAAPNNFTASWFGVDVLNDTVANIYQYYPGGFFATYKFKLPALVNPVLDVYVVGEIAENSNTWGANVGYKLTRGEKKIFGGVVTVNQIGSFGITTALGTTADDWTTLNANRYVPDNDGTVVENNKTSYMTQGSDKSWKFPQKGTYLMIVDLDSLNFKVKLLAADTTTVYPEKLYAIGNLGSAVGDWKPNDGSNELTRTDNPGVYMGQITIYNQVDGTAPLGYGWFCLGSALGTSDTDWTTFNASRFGPEVDNTILVSGVAGPLFSTTQNSYKVAIEAVSATYDVTANLVNHTILLTLVSTGVDKVSTSDVRVVAGTGEINIFGNAQNVSVYTAGGALISKNQVRVNCAPGMYVVRASGKTFKVMVK